MRIIWTPPGGEARDFLFRPEDLTPDLYEPIEAVGPWASFGEFVTAVRAGKLRAWRVALWTCLRRDDDPTIELDAVQPAAGEVQARYEPAEELLMAETILLDPDLTPGEREWWEQQLPALRIAAGKAPDPADDAAASPPDDGPGAGT